MAERATTTASRGPVAVGTALAALAALAFGATTPLIQRAGRDVGPFTTAALLYAGAAAVSSSSVLRRSATEAPVRKGDARRLVMVALAGAVVAPVCLAWGLKRTTGSAASLLLNFEAVFSVLLARLILREHLGRRVLVAIGSIVLGGALLASEGARASTIALAGSAAVVAATFAWAFDNTFTRPLADRDPTQVVFWKGAVGGVVSAVLGWIFGERLPSASAALAVAACGATGYGVSLRLYLLAQRRLGAARTGSIFAIAPFVGVGIAWALGERALTLGMVGAGACFAVGVYLHATEQHEHEHEHELLEHEHAHRHDDGHHDHEHDPPFVGEHSHAHQHPRRVHTHPHLPDLHHRHGHD